MRAERITAVLGQLGAKRIANKGTKVVSTCPLSPWKHTSRRHKDQTMVVIANDHDTSKCRCLSASCGFKGTIAQLVWAYGSLAKVDVSDLANVVQKSDQMDITAMMSKLEKADLGIFSTRAERGMPAAWTEGVEHSELENLIDKLPNLDAEMHRVGEMQRFLDDESLGYLRSPKRRMSDIAIDKWKIGWHPGARRIAIPQFDKDGHLVNIGGRYVARDNDDPFWTPPPWMHAKDFRKEFYLFGENFCSYDGKGVGVLVEGMFDAISLHTKGVPNVVAMLGAHISKYQFKKLITWFRRLVIVPDGDQPGREAADRIVSIVGRKMEVSVFPTDDGIDPDELSDNSVELLKQDYLFDNSNAA